MKDGTRIAIIGGGLRGRVAAQHFERMGHEVIVVDTPSEALLAFEGAKAINASIGESVIVDKDVAKLHWIPGMNKPPILAAAIQTDCFKEELNYINGKKSKKKY